MNKSVISFKKELLTAAVTLIAAVISAFTLHVFVYRADFAPSGVDGIATMLQKLTGFGAGYYTLIFNLPLLATGLFFLKKRFVIYTVVFTVVSSFCIEILAAVGFYQFCAQKKRFFSLIYRRIAHNILLLWKRITQTAFSRRHTKSLLTCL